MIYTTNTLFLLSYTIDIDREEKNLAKTAAANNSDKGGDGRTALHEAAGNGNIDKVVELLKNENHADMLTASDVNGWQGK